MKRQGTLAPRKACHRAFFRAAFSRAAFSRAAFSRAAFSRAAFSRAAFSRAAFSRAAFSRAAFSLVELLVVLALIAILMALLFPVLRAANDQVKRVQCISNMKQIGVGLGFFLADHDGTFPAYQGGPILGYRHFWGKVGTAHAGGEGDRLFNRYMGFDSVATASSSGILEVFHCPADNGRRPGRWNFSYLPTVWDAVGYSYWLNMAANSNNGTKGLYGRRMSEVVQPNKVVMAADEPFLAYWANQNPAWISLFHSKEVGWAPVLFVDGHVSYLQATYDAPTYEKGEKYTWVYNDPP